MPKRTVVPLLFTEDELNDLDWHLNKNNDPDDDAEYRTASTLNIIGKAVTRTLDALKAEEKSQLGKLSKKSKITR